MAFLTSPTVPLLSPGGNLLFSKKKKKKKNYNNHKSMNKNMYSQLYSLQVDSHQYQVSVVTQSWTCLC